jgi:hypothetical protein
MSATTEMSGAIEIRPFQVEIPNEALADLRRRLSAVRLPSEELVTGRSEVVQVAAIRELARHGATEYDWSRCEARLNALPQFKTEIDGGTSTSATRSRATRTPRRPEGSRSKSNDSHERSHTQDSRSPDRFGCDRNAAGVRQPRRRGGAG